MLENLNPYSRLLADGDIWSELLSLLFVLLFFAVPAIIRALAASAKNKPPEQEEKLAREKTYGQKIKPQRRQHLQSEWDRRQQLIRERLATLKEKEQGLMRPPSPAQQPAAKLPAEEVLPLAMPVYDIPKASPPPAPPKPVVQPPSKPTKPYQQYVAAVAQAPRHTAPVPHQPPVKKPKTGASGKQTAARTHSVLERIIAQSNPLKAGIILKEILDKPKSLGTDSGSILW